MKTACIFPGQGAQLVGMGKDFFDHFIIAKETFQEADDLLEQNLSKIIFEGPLDLLTQTKNSQLAIFVTSIALFRVILNQYKDFEPEVFSGLSLGEYTALAASKRLSFQETLFLVRERALLMNEACEREGGAMAAVLGLTEEALLEAIDGLKGVWAANFNAPGQIVISGTKEGVEQAGAILKQKGAKRVLPLTVHGAFHSPLMQSAQKGLESSILKTNLIEALSGFVMNVPGDFVTDPKEIKNHLICQVTHPVRWEQGIDAMKKAGVRRFLEIGPGKSLSGLNKKMGVEMASSIETLKDLEMCYAAT